MKQIVHVGRQTIASNHKHGTNEPPLILRDYRGSERAHDIELISATTGQVMGKFVYRPNNPLACGARVFLELNTDVCIARAA